MDVTIIVPTLNEEDNINLLLNRLLKVRSGCGINFDILFVDSASSDTTCQRVKDWQGKSPVYLLRRDINVGLAPAVIAAAHEVKSEYVLVMDADLSHPPEKVPELLSPLAENQCDMVIGSRYVPGGAMPDWPLTRKMSSRLATLPALFFCDVKDPLAGFFALKRNLITGLSKEVPGFKIGLAVLAEYHRNIRVMEIPIEFRDRDYGTSKMSKRVIFDYMRQLGGLTRMRLGL